MPWNGPLPPAALRPSESRPLLLFPERSSAVHRRLEEAEPPAGIDSRPDAERQRVVRPLVSCREAVPDRDGQAPSRAGEHVPDPLLRFATNGGHLPDDDPGDTAKPPGLDPLGKHPVDPVARLRDVLE